MAVALTGWGAPPLFLVWAGLGRGRWPFGGEGGERIKGSRSMSAVALKARKPRESCVSLESIMARSMDADWRAARRRRGRIGRHPLRRGRTQSATSCAMPPPEGVEGSGIAHVAVPHEPREHAAAKR